MRILHPPLQDIDDRTRLSPDLRAITSADIQPPEVTEPDAGPMQMPPHIAHRIRELSGLPRNTAEVLAPGLIVLITRRVDADGAIEQQLANPFAFCLDKLLTSYVSGVERWSGWIAAPEADYASDKDVLLETHDQPFDPMAAMVQTWNPLQLNVPAHPRLLTRLMLDRLEGIRTVARESVPADIKSLPGRVGLRSVAKGMMVLTGTPLGNINDPRWKYQQLYRQFAGSFLPVAANQENATRVVRPITNTAFGWRYAIAATVVASVSAALFFGYLGETARDELQILASNDSPAKEKSLAKVPYATREQIIPAAGMDEGAHDEIVATPSGNSEVAAGKAEAPSEISQQTHPQTSHGLPSETPPVTTALSSPTYSWGTPEPKSLPIKPPLFLATVKEAENTYHYASHTAVEESLPANKKWTHVLFVKNHDLVVTVLEKLRARKIVVSRVFAKAPLIILSLEKESRLDTFEKEAGLDKFCLKREEWLAEDDVKTSRAEH